MARVTVEDCVLKIPNRFDLVLKAAQRARDVAAGAALTIERDDDKNPVIALREIADETIDLEDLENTLIKGLQKHAEVDEPEEEPVDDTIIQDALAAETGVAGPEGLAQAGMPTEESLAALSQPRFEDADVTD